MIVSSYFGFILKYSFINWIKWLGFIFCWFVDIFLFVGLKYGNGMFMGISVIFGVYNEVFEEDIVNVESNKLENVEN